MFVDLHRASLTERTACWPENPTPLVEQSTVQMCVPFPKMGQLLSAMINGDRLLTSPSTQSPGREARAVASLEI